MMRDKEKTNVISGFKRIFRTLVSRNYRLFFTGQSISLIGTWMQRVAMSWLVYRLTVSIGCIYSSQRRLWPCCRPYYWRYR